MNIKHLFLNAVYNGDLGACDDLGVIVTLSEFLQKFPDIGAENINEFLPAATIDVKHPESADNQFLSCICKDVYRVDADVIETFSLSVSESEARLSIQ